MDLTPVGSVYFESVDTTVGDFDQVHMCRDMSKLRMWMADKASTIPKNLSTTGNAIDGFRHHGYVNNADALLPWNETGSEYQ
jgi:hypothetical protein